MVRIKYTGGFYRGLGEILRENGDYKGLVDLAIERFVENPKDTRLKVHTLKRRMRGKWAFNVDDDVRIVFEWLGKRAVRFLAIGKHGKVYRRN